MPRHNPGSRTGSSSRQNRRQAGAPYPTSRPNRANHPPVSTTAATPTTALNTTPATAPPPFAGIPHPARIGTFQPQQISHIANSSLYSTNGIVQYSQNVQEFMGNRVSYQPGQYGFRTSEQAYLSGLPGNPVTGANFQHEHSVGYEILGRGFDAPRGTAGAPSRVEKLAPAYQEVRAAHEGHLGTGGSGSPGDPLRPYRTDVPDTFKDDLPRDAAPVRDFFRDHPDRTIPDPEHWGQTRNQYGYRTDRYRDDQRMSIMDDRFSDAVQLNQSGYARDQAHRDARGTLDGNRADESYQRHVENMGGVPYAVDANTIRYTSPPTAQQRAEMFLAREIANTGMQPTAARRAEVLSYFYDLDNGLTPTHRPTIYPGQSALPYLQPPQAP